MKTVIGIVLDESSSMYDRKDQVINGFNKFLEDQKKITDDSARLFLVKFSSNVKVMHSGTPLEDLTSLTNQDYSPNGSTALYDAIAQCVQIMDEEKTPEERAICVIMTDGEENCSQKTSISDIQQIIKTHEQQNDWTFLYIGVEIAEWVKASGMRATNCSVGFAQHQQLPPSYPLNNSRVCKKRMINTRHLSNESEEMEQLASAISDFRSSKDSRSDDLFSSSNGEN